jgi:hypothetical protein
MNEDSMFQEMLAAGDITGPLVDANGQSEFSITVATDKPHEKKKEHLTVAYIIPNGYRARRLP